jgi:GTPase SAR1 family protein
MDAYQENREEILRINQEVRALLGRSAAVLDGNAAAFKQWERSCDTIARHLMDHVVRIAVVGAIKSGKSTLVNALLQDDYLKRGAGVVTSIVTRLRHGDELKARLFFKSWDEVNAEIRQALVLFPTEEWRSEAGRFDIRRGRDRRDLQRALDALDRELRVVQDSLNANGVLLASYLKGFDQIQALVSDESATREFDSGHFAEHREFVGNDALAVYLKDIELKVVGDVLTRSMEIADCQGSDSPNPLHLAMIQDYLLTAHLVIYVISSRTGVRQADIRFLSMIKRMGIAGNMLFVVNCDFNEHEGLSDLAALVQRINEELSMIVPGPDVFALSALYNLFGASRSVLSPRDKDRLAQWRKAKEMTAFSDEETLRLKAALDRKLIRERSVLLLQNQLERIDVTANGLQQRLALNRDLLRRDTGDAQSMADRLHAHQARMLQVQAMIQSTLEGAVRKAGRDLKTEADRFFDMHRGPVLKKVSAFVRDYNVDLDRSQERLGASGFTQMVYLVFQEIKQAVDNLMAEQVNPEIIGFVRQQEAQLQAHLRMVAEPYEAMIRDALARYEDALGRFGLNPVANGWTFNAALDLAAVKHALGLALPPAAASMRYSANIKADAVIRLGIYTVVHVLRRVFNRPPDGEKAQELQALKDSIRKMKKEIARAITMHFKDYRENLKFQYLEPLARMAGNRLYDTLTEQFAAYVGDVKDLAAAINERRNDRTHLDNMLEENEKETANLRARLNKMRAKIGSMMIDGVAATEPAAE